MALMETAGTISYGFDIIKVQMVQHRDIVQCAVQSSAERQPSTKQCTIIIITKATKRQLMQRTCHETLTPFSRIRCKRCRRENVKKNNYSSYKTDHGQGFNELQNYYQPSITKT